MWVKEGFYVVLRQRVIFSRHLIDFVDRIKYNNLNYYNTGYYNEVLQPQ